MELDTWAILTVYVVAGTFLATYIISTIFAYKALQSHTLEGQKTIEKLLVALRSESPSETLEALAALDDHHSLAQKVDEAPEELADEGETNITVKSSDYGSIKVDGRTYDLVDSPDYVKEVLYGQKEL